MMSSTNINPTKKTEQELKANKNFEQIHSDKNIKKTKNDIANQGNVKTTKKNKIFIKRQSKETIEDLEIKRKRTIFVSNEKNFQKLEKTNSSSFLPQSRKQKENIDIKDKNYDFGKYHETKTLKSKNSKKQVIIDHQKKKEIINEQISLSTIYKKPKIKRPNSLSQRTTQKTVRRPDFPFQENIYEKKDIIKSRSITHAKTSPTKLNNINSLNTENIIKKKNNQDTLNFGDDRPNIIPNYENILSQIISKEDCSQMKFETRRNQLKKEKEIKKTHKRKSNSIAVIENESKRINKIKKAPIIKQFYEESEPPIIDNEYRKRKSQGKKDEASNDYFKIFLENSSDSTNIVDSESARKNSERKISANIECKLKRKISDEKNESFISATDSNRKYYHKKGRFMDCESDSDSESESINNESVIDTNIKTCTSKKKVNDLDNNASIYEHKFQFQEEITSEIINNKKVSYLTKNITDFYNKYISICSNDILIDKNRYPLPKFPKISVIIPLYNATKFLHYSLRSVQNQKMKEIEIILVDDCSTDDTLLLVNKYMKEDPRIRLIKNKENRKILYSKSIGALNAKGKYILQLDQDDLFIRDDLFDILFNEAENNNLDLVQIKDITTNNLLLDDKTKVNCHSRYQINLGESFESMPTHYETSEQLKAKLYIDGWVFTIWGLLIKTDIYKKAIYYLWPVILNYKFTYYEDYIITTIIIFFLNIINF